jgi:crotonobetainyl-CoA:carnitine CoA-transferase CaiB-like acyl-CoA transferase
MFKRFARLIGQEELCADPQFQSDEQRAARGETLSKLASNWSHSMTSDMALAALEHARVPAGALLSHRDILGDTEIRAHYFEDVSIQGLALSVPYARSAIKLSATPACSPSGPPSPGSDTLSLLDDLGYEADEIRKFEQSKLI